HQEARRFHVIKEKVLKELKLSVGDYKRLFMSSTKRPNEGWPSYVTRLRSYLTYYLSGRNVTTFETLVELMVSDHLKDTLATDFVKYLKLREPPDAWKTPADIAELAQHFEEANGRFSVQASSAPRNIKHNKFSAEAPSYREGKIRPAEEVKQSSPVVKSCSYCNKRGHTLDTCFRKRREESASRNVASGSKGPVGKISPVEHDFACRRLVKLSMRDVPICAKLDTGA